MRVAQQLALLAIIATLGSFVQVNGAKYSKCPAKRDAEMDACAAKMGFLGDHNFTVPKNLTSMSQYCGQLKESIACIQSYAHDCLQGFTHDSKSDFLNKMACLTDDKILSFHHCMDASIARFEYIDAHARSHTKLPGICCSFQLFNRDLDTTLSSLCGDKASTTGEFVHKLVSGTAGEFFSLICDQHRSLAECKASSKTAPMMEGMESIQGLVHAGKLKPKNKSLVPILLQILDGSSN